MAGSSKSRIQVLFMVCFLSSTSVWAATPSWATTDLVQQIGGIFRAVTGWKSMSPARRADFNQLIERAHAALNRTGLLRKGSLSGLLPNKSRGEDFVASRVVGDANSSTVKFTQSYQGVEVIGNEAMVHFDASGDVHDVSGKPVEASVDIRPRLSAQDALKILINRYQQRVALSAPAKLKIFHDFDGKTRLIYDLLTKTTATHDGQEVFLDAHDGSIVIEMARGMDLDGAGRGNRTVLSASTDRARQNVDGRGYPTDMELGWYVKVIENGKRFDKVDRSATNAYVNSGRVYSYFKNVFNRSSYDGHDSPLVSVVHMGVKLNNAFWSDELKIMAYGDGDGENMMDLTYGLDVAAHEMTHAITSDTARLIYAGESGALNESYSDFFGRMVDYREGHWDMAARIMSPKSKNRALRNMMNPEEFKQPGNNESALRKATRGSCNVMNDRCGVHINNGIPNHAAALIVEAIGKAKAEQLYYKVLTERLSATSNFHDARQETEKECERSFGKDSNECQEVSKAFDIVKM